METRERLEELIKGPLVFSGGLDGIGLMKQSTLHRRLDECMRRLSDTDVVAIYNAWLQAKTDSANSYKDLVEAYCEFLEPFGWDPIMVKRMWDNSTRGGTRNSQDQRHIHMIAREIERQYGKVKNKEETKTKTDKGRKGRDKELPTTDRYRPASSVDSYRPAPASTENKEDLLLKLEATNVPECPTVNSKLQRLPTASHVWASQTLARLDARQSASKTAATAEPRSLDHPVIDLTRDPWNTGPSGLLAFLDTDDVDNAMPPPPDYVCHKCGRKGRHTPCLASRQS
jgi:hypothetical protein